MSSVSFYAISTSKQIESKKQCEECKDTLNEKIRDQWLEKFEELQKKSNTLKIPLYFSKPQLLTDKETSTLNQIISKNAYHHFIEINGKVYSLSQILDSLNPQSEQLSKLYQMLVQNVGTTTSTSDRVPEEMAQALSENIQSIKREKNTIKIIQFSSHSEQLSSKEEGEIEKIIGRKQYDNFVDIDGIRRSLLTVLCADFSHFQYPDLVKGLIQNGYDINQEERGDSVKGYTAFLRTIANGNYQNAIKLMKYGNPFNFKKGLNIDLKDPKFGNNALLLCLKKGIQKDPDGWNYLVEHLIWHTLDLNDHDELGNTALHIAALRRDVPLVEALINCGADRMKANNFGHLPIDFWNADRRDLCEERLRNILGYDTIPFEEQGISFDIDKRQSIDTPPEILKGLPLIFTFTAEGVSNIGSGLSNLSIQKEKDPRQEYLTKAVKLADYLDAYEKVLQQDSDELSTDQDEKIKKVTQLAVRSYRQSVMRKLHTNKIRLASKSLTELDRSNCLKKDEKFASYLKTCNEVLDEQFSGTLPIKQAKKIDSISAEAIRARKESTQLKLNTLDIILSSSFPGFMNPDAEDVTKIKEIIERGCFNISVKRRHGSTKLQEPLLKILCAFVNRFRDNGIIKALLKKGFDLNQQDTAEYHNPYPGNTILHWTVANAYYQNAIELIKLGIKYDLNVNLMDENEKNNALLLALKKGIRQDPAAWKELVLLLIDYTKLNKPDFEGNTPLHIACFRREEDIVKKLIQKGADPKRTNSKGQLPADLWRLEIRDLKDQNLEDIINYDIESSGEDDSITFDISERDKRSKEPPKEFEIVKMED